MNQPLVVFRAPVPVVQIEGSAEAFAARDEVVAIAKLVPEVVDDRTRQIAVNAIADIKRLMADAEKARKAIKEPFIEGGRAIDNAKAEFCVPLLSAWSGLDEQVTAYETGLRELAAEQERLRQKELVELQKTLPPAEAQAQVEELAPQLPLVPAKGQSVRETWDYEVLDLAQLWMAYGARLVTLSEKRQAILDLINSPDCPTRYGVPGVPGLRVKRVVKSRIQPAKAPPLLDVKSEVQS
jgi:hypothetical protein